MFTTPPLFRPTAVTLAGAHVRLEPMATSHAEGLLAAGHFPALWEVTVQPPLDSAEAVEAYIASSLASGAAGTEVPFVICRRDTGEVIGSTRIMDIAPAHRRVEIGGSWVTPAHQRSPVNTETKLLLLTYLFETLGAYRVQFKTDARNQASQRALSGIGARCEGTLRRHMVVRDGFVRDSVYYGITDDDWPQVKTLLHTRLRRQPDPTQRVGLE